MEVLKSGDPRKWQPYKLNFFYLFFILIEIKSFINKFYMTLFDKQYK